MCWVIPPASDPVTLLSRMASRRVVLPWSTCPMMVTTGGRGRRSSSRSASWSIRLSTSGATFSTTKPYSCARSPAVSASSSWLTVVGIPISMSFLITSAALIPMRCARSPTVTTSSIFSSRLLALGGTVEGAFFSRTGRPPLRFAARPGENFLDDRLLQDPLLHLLLVGPGLLPLLFLFLPDVLRFGRRRGLFDDADGRLGGLDLGRRLGGHRRRRHDRRFGSDGGGLLDGRRRGFLDGRGRRRGDLGGALRGGGGRGGAAGEGHPLGTG